jgi:quinol monooxygenase YgiN
MLAISISQLEEVMYARITTFRMNTEKSDDALALTEELRPEIMAIPGIKYWFDLGNEDGNTAVIAIYESEEAAEAAKGTAGALFARFADYMETEPQPQGYEVLLHGINP